MFDIIFTIICASNFGGLAVPLYSTYIHITYCSLRHTNTISFFYSFCTLLHVLAVSGLHAMKKHFRSSSSFIISKEEATEDIKEGYG